MFSDNNAILIGKNGQTLSALTLLCKQAIYSQLGIYVYINLDVENYKDKQIAHLERLAKNIAREVRQTQTPVVMDNMNSYERRVVHNILTNFKGVKTESEGEEPNRHIIVKPAKE
jgi:spoIIIJ-associated protein